MPEWAQRSSPPGCGGARTAPEAIAELCDRLGRRVAKPIGQIVRDAGYTASSTLKRDLGILKQPVRDATAQPIYNDELDVDVAGRIVRALGLSPCEVPWL